MIHIYSTLEDCLTQFCEILGSIHHAWINDYSCTSLKITVQSKEHWAGNRPVKHRTDKALDLHVPCIVYDVIISCRQFQGSKINLVYKWCIVLVYCPVFSKLMLTDQMNMYCNSTQQLFMESFDHSSMANWNTCIMRTQGFELHVSVMLPASIWFWCPAFFLL